MVLFRNVRNFTDGTHSILVSAWKIEGIAEVYYTENHLTWHRCKNLSHSGIKTKNRASKREMKGNVSYLTGR